MKYTLVIAALLGLTSYDEVNAIRMRADPAPAAPEKAAAPAAPAKKADAAPAKKADAAPAKKADAKKDDAPKSD